MTVRSTRTSGLIVVGAASFWTVVILLFAFLLRQPVFAVTTLFIAGAGTAAGVSLLRTKTFGFDGADLVYGRPGKEKRVPRADVATGRLVGQTLIFSNAAGGQLLTVPYQLFKDSDVAAVCSMAGIAMSGVPTPLQKSRTALSQAKLWVGASVFCVLGCCFMVGVGIWTAVISRQDLAAYQAAPVCEGAAPASGCRFEGTAAVTGVEGERSYSLIHLKLADGTAMDAELPLADVAPTPSSAVEIEIWNRRVSLINGIKTRDNPALNPNVNDDGAIAGFVVFLLVAIGLLVGGLFQLRRARATLGATTAAATGMTEPVWSISVDASLPH